MRKLLCVLLAALALTASLSACTDAPISKTPRLSSANLMAQVKSQKTEAAPIAGDFSQGYTDFSLDLLTRAAAGDEDALVSPLSILMALGLAANGADGDTKAAFDVLFGTQNANESFKALMTGLTENASPEVILTLANALWVDDDFQESPDFLQKNADYFSAGAYRNDLQDKETVKDINAWIAANTGDKIQDLIGELDENAKLLLVNALYFKAPWLKPFTPAFDGIFHAPGADVTVPMMDQTAGFSLFENENFKSVLLPYKDSDLAFLAVLPDERIPIRDFVLSADDYRSILAGQDEVTRCLVRMPVFTAGSKVNLNDILSDMGLSIAFDPGRADFSKMGTYGEANLYITNVSHATWIAVTETGTEAAAATSIEMAPTSAEFGPPEIILDRPFLYGIVDTASGLPLFLGILSNP